MGAFLRYLGPQLKRHNVNADYSEDRYKSSENKQNLRIKLVQRMLQALTDVKGWQEQTYHVCYPTHKLQESSEDTNNKDAFEHVMGSQYSNIFLAPGIDSFALANHFAKMGLNTGMLNAANAKRIGNHWFSIGAGNAIDKNIHRCSCGLGLTSLMLNGGYADESKSKDLRVNVEKYLGIVINL